MLEAIHELPLLYFRQALLECSPSGSIEWRSVGQSGQARTQIIDLGIAALSERTRQYQPIVRFASGEALPTGRHKQVDRQLKGKESREMIIPYLLAMAVCRTGRGANGFIQPPYCLRESK